MDLVLAFSMGVVAANYVETRKYLVSVLPYAIPLALGLYKSAYEKCKRQNIDASNDLELPHITVVKVPVIRRPKKETLPPSPAETPISETPVTPTKPCVVDTPVTPTQTNSDLPSTPKEIRRTLFGPNWTNESSFAKDLPPAIVSELSINEEAE